MATYLIGDVHGCYHELRALLAQADLDPQQMQIMIAEYQPDAVTQAFDIAEDIQ